MRIYLDTSVYGGYYDKGMEASIDLINAINIREIEVVYSDLIITEFDKAPQFISEKLYAVLYSINDKKVVKTTKDVNGLADSYIRYGILPPQSFNDAKHIAIAVINEIDYVVSWNFNHMVGRNLLYKEVSKLLDLKQVDIVKPDIFLREIIRWKH